MFSWNLHTPVSAKKMPDSTANGTKSTAKVINSIAKTCKYCLSSNLPLNIIRMYVCIKLYSTAFSITCLLFAFCASLYVSCMHAFGAIV